MVEKEGLRGIFVLGLRGSLRPALSTPPDGKCRCESSDSKASQTLSSATGRRSISDADNNQWKEAFIGWLLPWESLSTAEAYDEKRAKNRVRQ